MNPILTILDNLACGHLRELVFDMDGTIAALYGVEGWLSYLQSYQTYPYEVAKPMWEMRLMVSYLNRIRACGVKVSVVTWLAKNSTPDYDTAVAKAKREWLSRYHFPCDNIHIVPYGTPKHQCVEHFHRAIIIDDDARVRNDWGTNRAINPCEVDLIAFLRRMAETAEKYHRH